MVMFELYEVATGVKVHKLLKPSRTQWISLKISTDQIIDQWVCFFIGATAAR